MGHPNAYLYILCCLPGKAFLLLSTTPPLHAAERGTRLILTCTLPLPYPQYFIILLVLFVVLLVGGIVGYVFKHRVQDTITAQMMASLDEYQSSQTVKDAWDAAQTKVPSPMNKNPLGRKCFGKMFKINVHVMNKVTFLLCSPLPLDFFAFPQWTHWDW